jgi:eukaryotic-like serine/threonine-protein kinase
MTPTLCPTRDQLQAIVDGSVCDTELSDLTRHLDDCVLCQQALQDLAAGDEHWPAVAAQIGEPQRDTALQHVMESLKDDLHSAGETNPGDAELALDFLDPPDKQGLLGRVDHYEVTEIIGRGGMGVVLKALDPTLNRYVAIKVIAPQLATSAAARKRFAREARAAAAISHEHVVAIHDIDEIKGLPYLVMEYVAGVSLQERLDRSGPLELKEILRIGIQAASGLAAAHAQGLIHRDIKPANILLENCIERVKITDFGLARMVDDASLTQSGVLAGTPQYMAPEQARGDAQDHRVDLFSLGSVLYTLCTGHPPFRASTTMAVLRRVSDETPRSVRVINPEIPDWLAAIVEKLHAKDPANRYQSAAEVADLLAQHLAHLQQPSLVPMPQSAPRKSVSRMPARPRWAMAAAVVLCVLGGLSISEATGGTQITQFVATVLRIRTPEGTLVLQVDDPEVNVNVDQDGNEITITGAGVHEIKLRPGSYHWQATKDGKPVRDDVVTISRGGKEVVKVSLEPDPKFAAGGSTKTRINASHAKAEVRDHAVHEAEALRSSAEAMQLLTEKKAQELEGKVKVLRNEVAKRDYLRAISEAERQFNDRALAFKVPEKITLPHSSEVFCLAFAPDGKTLATGTEHGKVWLWDILTPEGSAAPRAAQSRGAAWLDSVDVLALTFSPDGKTLATGDRKGMVQVFCVQGPRSAVRAFDAHQGPVSSVAFSPDGKLLAVGNAERGVQLMEAATGKQIRPTLQGSAVGGVAFSPDGKWLASAGSDGAVRVWDSESGREIRQLAAMDGKTLGLAVSPDGKRFAVMADGSVRVLDAASGKVREQIHTGGALAGIAFSPDGKVLAAGGDQATVHLFDAATGREIRRIQVDGPVTALTFSPNGGVLAAATRSRTVTLWPMQERGKGQTTNAPIRLGLRLERGKEVIRVDGKDTSRDDLTNQLINYVKEKRTTLLLTVDSDVPYTAVKDILSAAEQAGIKHVQFVNEQPSSPRQE